MSYLVLRRLQSLITNCQQCNYTNVIRSRALSCSCLLRLEDKGKTSSIDNKEENKSNDKTTITAQTENWLPDDLSNRSSNPRPFGDYSYPHNLHKVALLWGNYFKTREEIPSHIKMSVQLAADDKLRTIIFYWMMSTSIFFFLTIVYMGRRRYYQYINMISKKQNEVWAAREKLETSGGK